RRRVPLASGGVADVLTCASPAPSLLSSDQSVEPSGRTLMTSGIEILRESASAMRRILDETGDDPSLVPAAVDDALRPVLDRLDLFDVGMPRKSNHTDASSVIYFDPKLCYILARASKGQSDPPHNHGVWNITAVCTGEMHYRAYRRVDDRSEPGHAE